MLSAECYDPFELALLGSTRQDVPPPQALRRVATALGVALPAAGLPLLGSAGASGGAISTAAPATGASTTIGAAVTAAQPVASKITLAVVAKHIGVGMLAGTVTVGGAQGAYHVMSSPESRPTATVEVAAPVAAREHGSPATPRRTTHPLDTTSGVMGADDPPIPLADLPHEASVRNELAQRLAPTGTEPGHSSVDVDEPLQGGANPVPAEVDPKSVAAFALPSAESPVAPPAAQPAHRHPARLTSERRCLARARSALGRRDPAEALRLLDAHAIRFPRGKLKGHANVLRVEALLQAERREEALSVGRREILRAPSRQKVKRIRALFDRKSDQ
jgi:hypothetical protein